MNEKFSQRRTLYFEFDQDFATPTNIYFTPQKYAGAVGRLPSLASLLFKKKKQARKLGGPRR